MPSLWLKPRGPKFQGLVMSPYGMSTPSLVKFGLLPYPVESKYRFWVTVGRFITYDFANFADS